jgi:dTDP-4-amino-4,6-dideoxygalactose transaminase
MKIELVDLRAQYLKLQPEIDRAILDVVQHSSFIGGRHVEEFEREYAKRFGVEHCISTANGTDSLYIVLKMLGIGPGDEVITVANSWISSSETISQTGAKPIFVDIDTLYSSIDENALEDRITERTKCIVPVHLFGQPCNMERIVDISEKFKLPILEDCAQSHLAEYKGKLTGTFGVAGSFSFYPGKNLGAYGDAGCIITNDDDLAKKCRMFARHGALVKHKHVMEGINSRLDGIQAAILNVKLPYLDAWTIERNRVAERYTKTLQGCSQIVTPLVRPGSTHAFHLYVVRARKRDQLQQQLREMGVGTGIHYPTPLPFLEAYTYLNNKPEDFIVAAQHSKEILSLPMYAELSDEQIDYVCDAIKVFYDNPDNSE